MSVSYGFNYICFVMNGVETYNESVQIKRWNMVFSLLVEMDLDDCIGNISFIMGSIKWVKDSKYD